MVSDNLRSQHCEKLEQGPGVNPSVKSPHKPYLQPQMTKSESGLCME